MHHSRKASFALFVLPLAISGWLFAGAVQAADFPAKQVEMTVLFGAGSGADLLARKLAEFASKELGQPVVVSNRTGAGGAIGYNHVRQQPADGHSIVWNSNSISTAYHAGNMAFDYTAYRGVVELTTEPVCLVVKADSPWKDLKAFVSYAKQNPGKVRVGNSGRGSFTHLSGVALENRAGVKFNHVPFGQELAVMSVLGGKIEASIQLPAEIASQTRSNQVKVLAVSGDKRLPSLPDAPTFKEAGVELELSLWRGIAVPKGTPDDAVARLEQAFRTAAGTPSFREFAAQMGANVELRSSKDFDKFMAQQDQELAALMEQVGMKKQ